MTTTTKKLKRGARIRIYEKPLTGEDFEGVATLLQPIRAYVEEIGTRQVYLWSVRFEGEDHAVSRSVSPDDLC